MRADFHPVASGPGGRKPTVSIGLPNHNGGRFLSRALGSLLDQDYEDFEIVVCDNASTDDSLEVTQAFAREDQRVRVHRQTENRGAAWNFNQAFHLSRGEYFKWAAHDDMYEPSFLRRCVEALDQDPEVVLAYTQTVDIDEEDRPIAKRVVPPVAHDGGPRERMRSVLLTSTPCFEVFGVARRDALARTRLIGAYTSSDRTLLFELASHGRFRLVDDELFLHRQHADRSVHQYPRGRDRSAWFDPRLRGAITFPRWRLLGEYTRVVASGPLHGRDRRGAVVDLGRWTVNNGSQLIREALGGGRDRVLRELSQRRRGRHAD